MPWMHKGQPVNEIDIKKYVSFVYKITNLIDGRFYIGYKQTTFAKTKQVKGKKKRIQIESDWRDYWSSSDELKADVLALGEENFTREILYFCHSKSMGSYLELREQIDHRVMENPQLTYNGIVNARVSRMHLKNVLQYIKDIT
jgi:hypothetical protein